MVWAYVLIGIVLVMAVVEWTSRPHGDGNAPAADPDVAIPQPRSGEHDRSVHFTRPVDRD